MIDEPGLDGEDRLDLSPLDPQADAAHFEHLQRGIQRAAASELWRRQNATGVWGLLVRWRRYLLTSTGLLAFASVVILLFIPPSTFRRATLAEASGVPKEWVRWIQSDQNPTPGDLLGTNRSEQ